jgi:hypothetical protein
VHLRPLFDGFALAFYRCAGLVCFFGEPYAA